jgi:hypothetical protein
MGTLTLRERQIFVPAERSAKQDIRLAQELRFDDLRVNEL